ncbi:Apple domain-containing protein [Caenorhabditis elegans]|uniref:Apple domain-containing protein n=1 Tax=Caenorhabditis elegans TaxID=6239 RepID=A0A5K1IAU3_CAEEL|nr:Apple domain-containing protein [Caenorhabditis elegans]VWL57844.1 Apple domain-containing protein [Caenorhabditis elegans]
MLLLYLFYFLSPSWAQNLTDMIAQNPLLAKMSMFQEYQENSTIPLPSSPEDSDEEDFIKKMSTKRSSSREAVSDNFDQRYHQMNRSLFDQADLEIGDLDYREMTVTSSSVFPSTSTDDVDLQRALVDEASEFVTEFQPESESESESTSPFSASASIFATPIATSTEGFEKNSFSRSSPYFKAFPTAATSQFVSSHVATSQNSFATSFNDVTAPDFSTENPSTPIILSQTTSDEEEKFFTEPEDSDTDVEDISSKAGMPTSSFQGTSLAKLSELKPEEFEFHQIQKKKQDENEVVQFNGRYSVSATKYYVDNRIDGEHYENSPSVEIEDTIQENGVEEVDPFAVEREMRKMARMHAAKTRTFDDPLKGLEFLMEKDQERRRLSDELPDTELVSMETDKNGKTFEQRQTTHEGRKTIVNLYNKNLYGHDLMRFPGAIFDDKIDEPRQKSDKRRTVASRIVLSSDEFSHINPTSPRLRKVVAGVTTNVKTDKNMFVDAKIQKTTEDVESVCYNSKKNTAITKIRSFETDDNLSKLECLIKCSRTPACLATTYSMPLATCAMYEEIKNLAGNTIRSQGHSLHRKLSKTTARCVRMFVSREVFGDLDKDSEEEEFEDSPTFLRLVEKDSSVSSSLLFSQRPKCPDGQDVIFVRSNDVESSNNHQNYVEITEDDCVFACLTNSRPGGGASDCTALEYDKTRGFCYLMTSPPADDVAMTPRPRNPVTSYEKICIQKSSANKCSGGQPIRYRQKVLIGHLVDAHSVGSAAECIDLCIEKHIIGCVSVMFYAKETTLNCILNDSTNLEDPASFFDETATIVDFFSIQDCLGIREVNRRAKKRKIQNRIEKLARLRRKMARM